MNKLRILGFAFIAVVVSGAVASASALAAAEWLDNGAAITTAIPVLFEMMTDLLFEDMGPSNEIECSEGEWEGAVGPSTASSVTSLVCLLADTLSGQCESLPTAVILTVEGLPWVSTLSLVEVGGVNGYRILMANIGLVVECTSALLGKITDLCEAPDIVLTATNDAATGTVLLETTEETELTSEGGTCHGPLGGKLLVLAGGDLLIVSDAGLAITVSG